MIQNETGNPYGTAHNASANPDDEYLQQKMVDAIANLATAMASDCAAISQLTATVARLAIDLATVNTKLIVTLQKNLSSWVGRGGRDRTTCGRGSRARAGAGTGNGAGAPARTGASAPTMDEAKYLKPPIYYCCTCGLGSRHNSSKCPVPAA